MSDQGVLPNAGRTVTLWDTRQARRWVVRAVVVPVILTGLLAAVWVGAGLSWGSVIPFVVISGVVGPLGAGRNRVRLTADAVEARGWRTRVFPYADLASVELSPDWEDDGAQIWLRLRTALPQTAPDRLVPPDGWRGRHPTGLQDAVAAIRLRVEAARAGARG